MSKYFTREFRARWSASNALGHVELSEYFRYITETAWSWGATIGLSIAESSELGLAWIIRETDLRLHRPLYPDDVFEVTIWLSDWRRVHGARSFELRLKAGGELIAQGVQEVVSVDLSTLRPAATPDHIIDKLRIDNPRVVPHQKFPRLRLKRDAAFVFHRTVEWRDLDAQERVNNAHYAAFAEEAAIGAFDTLGWSPANFKTRTLAIVNRHIHIQHLSPAAWAETLQIAASVLEVKPSGGVWHVSIERASDQGPVAECLLEWSLADRNQGTEQALPESLAGALRQRIALAEMNGG